jgi:hypothetical protein
MRLPGTSGKRPYQAQQTAQRSTQCAKILTSAHHHEITGSADQVFADGVVAALSRQHRNVLEKCCCKPRKERAAIMGAMI